jgi:rod shape determining protein RodA
MFKRDSIVSNIDWTTIVIYVILVFMGWLNIYAAVYNEQHSSILDFSQRYGLQLIWIFLAFLLILFIFMVDLKFYPFFAYIIYGFTVFLLVLVLIFGREINGARAWLKFGLFTIQPGEFAKLGTALAIAKYLSSYNTKVTSLRSLFAIGAIMFFPMVLILLQPDAGSLLVFFSFSIVLFREGLPGAVLLFGFVTGVLFFTSLLVPQKLYMIASIIGIGFVTFAFYSKKYKETGIGLLSFGGLGLIIWAFLYLTHRKIDYAFIASASFLIAGLGFLVVSFFRRIRFLTTFVLFMMGSILFTYSVDYFFNHVLEPHQRERMDILLGLKSDPLGKGYNVNQSMIAIGSGGFAGKGYLQGTQTKFNFVPEQSTDFIFCTIGEEWGFLGTFVVITLFLFLLLRIVIIAERQRSVFSRVYAYSVASILFFHIAINIGMTIGLLPVIGIPLPFFSAGGSSLWAFTILLFILLRLDASRLELLK